jgi:endonuclease/exonuclease/phosphatase family metal-dependent hydrolase
MPRIATYNVWNASTNWANRLAAIAEEVARLDADIVALQEVPVEAEPGLPIPDYLRAHTPYPRVLHLPYPGPADKREWPEGLAFLSQHPLTDVRANWQGGRPTENSWAARTVIQWQGRSLGVTNVHLDWRHAESRARHIVRIVRELIEARPCDIEVLCGDFNDDNDAPVLRFLAGQVELDGYRTGWRDLAEEWHAARGEPAPVTLDFRENPRWQPKGITAPSKRFDRIYLRTTASTADIHAEQLGVFGKVPANSLGIVPSDHYGLVVDLDIGSPDRLR